MTILGAFKAPSGSGLVTIIVRVRFDHHGLHHIIITIIIMTPPVWWGKGLPTGNVELRHLEVEQQLMVDTHLQLSSSSSGWMMLIMIISPFTSHITWYHILRVKIIKYIVHCISSYQTWYSVSGPSMVTSIVVTFKPVACLISRLSYNISTFCLALTGLHVMMHQ